MSSRVFKICPVCKTMNENAVYCVNCGELLDLEKKRAIVQEEEKASKKSSVKPNGLSLFFENAKSHRFFLVRWLARFFYSVWVVGLGIAFVFGMIVLYMAA